MSKDGGPAFPTTDSWVVIGGMSLRDWFAGQALAGIFAAEGRDGRSWGSTTEMAGFAYDAADEMLKEREK